jgi:hypothetical protein
MVSKPRAPVSRDGERRLEIQAYLSSIFACPSFVRSTDPRFGATR